MKNTSIALTMAPNLN